MKINTLIQLNYLIDEADDLKENGFPEDANLLYKRKYVAVDELAPQLDKVYDILSNETLSFEERISMAKLRLLEIDKELKVRKNEQ